MIFVTVGTVLPFDRMIADMDNWASTHPSEDVIAQIGDTAYIPKHMQYFRAKGGPEYLALLQSAELIVAHAGMGSVISALENGVPIVLLPRLQSRREHTTDHQMHSAAWLKNKPGVFVADTDAELPERIEQARAFGRFQAALNHFAPQVFTNRLRGFILDDAAANG